MIQIAYFHILALVSFNFAHMRDDANVMCIFRYIKYEIFPLFYEYTLVRKERERETEKRNRFVSMALEIIHSFAFWF
jgi:hypothetical protein